MLRTYSQSIQFVKNKNNIHFTLFLHEHSISSILESSITLIEHKYEHVKQVLVCF